jgi:probable F420-dependent oxidoreductase
MRYGIHMPQFGQASGPDSVRKAAIQAEDLGYDDIWVSDHLAVPKDAQYPPTAYIHEPIVTLTWAAAATKRVGLGTSILVLPMRRPLVLAKMLSSLDIMSGERLIVGAASGWLKEEFDALGVPFNERGKRTDETIALLRACWTEDPVNFDAKATGGSFVNMRANPRPNRHIPIWVGGMSNAALDRAIAVGDGWHASGSNKDDLGASIARLRAARPEKEFTISTREHWDALDGDVEDMKRQIAKFQEQGVQHMMFQPRQRYADDWLRSVELLWEMTQGV